jgi:hypothetical protein
MLKFYYQPGATLGSDSWSEQRFTLNKSLISDGKGLKDIWMQYDVYIPSNYFLYDYVPQSNNYFGGGHKVAVFYADEYSGPNSTMIFGEVFARRDSDNSGTRLTDNVNLIDAKSMHKAYYIDSTFSVGNPTAPGERIYSHFGTNESTRAETWVKDNDRNAWQRRTFHFKFPTSATSNDGVLEVWIQRFAASGAVSKELNTQNGNYFGYNQNYFNAGYINGYINGGFKSSTIVNMLVDNFILAEGCAASSSGTRCIPAAIDENAITQ